MSEFTYGVKNQSVAVGHDDQRVSVVVDTEVAKAITRWAERNSADLDAELAPFGLHSTDIFEPEYRRVVTREELVEALGLA
ncbi:hypothetical protein [Curtobacterium sp. USHLN213]|uniref:hypothetical protein n=1 Tax=Curtobacterium sp. USHLN213 TaxID=3081255 RepID=UPI00301915BD